MYISYLLTEYAYSMSKTVVTCMRCSIGSPVRLMLDMETLCSLSCFWQFTCMELLNWSKMQLQPSNFDTPLVFLKALVDPSI